MMLPMMSKGRRDHRNGRDHLSLLSLRGCDVPPQSGKTRILKKNRIVLKRENNPKPPNHPNSPT
jgi:hypothetical protein